MDKEPRKASDVLLSLESKLDILINTIRSHDLNIKVLSNKLNTVMEALEKQKGSSSKITVEAVNTLPASPFQQSVPLDPERQIPIIAESNLPMEKSPNGFRRTSRPETFSGDDVYLVNDKVPEIQPKFPVQMPKPPPGRTATEAVPVPPTNVSATATKPPSPPKEKQKSNVAQNAIPVVQRIVDKNGKSVFLADVEVIDLSTMEAAAKTRTNGTGKWMASLGVGSYRIFINKRESLNKEKVEVAQDIQVDGSTSPLELQTMIIK